MAFSAKLAFAMGVVDLGVFVGVVDQEVFVDMWAVVLEVSVGRVASVEVYFHRSLDVPVRHIQLTRPVPAPWVP